MAERVLSVTQLNEYVSGLLAFDPMLKRIAIKGEVSGYKRYSSGHLYFTLKDAASQIRCVCFRQDAQGLGFLPSDGMSVVASGSVALYTRDGAYQFYVKAMTRAGIGDLHARFEELKERLAAEGLFSAERKRPLPYLPRCIGIVTSQEGAVIQDIVRVAHRRFPGMKLLLSPAKVQGEGAANDIARAISRLAASKEADVIIVGRGGGSMEDLWAFNEEVVARAIFECPVPVISAVGHETDFTIADFVADMRAPTPSAAAELATPQKRDLEAFFIEKRRRLHVLVTNMIEIKRQKLEFLASSHAMRGVLRRVSDERLRLDRLLERLIGCEAALIAQKRADIIKAAAVLDELSPLSVLRRGYAIAYVGEELLSSVKQAHPGAKLTIQLADGKISAEVSEKLAVVSEE